MSQISLNTKHRALLSAFVIAGFVAGPAVLTSQYLPALVNGSCNNGNWELSMIEAMMNIGVFNDDQATFQQAVTMWRGRTPAYIYMSRDGPTPVIPPGCGPAIWGNRGITTEYGDGLLQETCRDSQHANFGLAAMVNTAETAWQQGVDLYGEEGDRIMAALEFQGQFLPPNSNPVPDWVCQGTATFEKHPTWEIAYNHYGNRLGYSLPNMQAVITEPGFRPTGVNHMMVWETLTHAEDQR